MLRNSGAWLEISIHGCHYIIEGLPKNSSYLQDLKIPRVPGTRGTRSNQAPVTTFGDKIKPFKSDLPFQ